MSLDNEMSLSSARRISRCALDNGIRSSYSPVDGRVFTGKELLAYEQDKNGRPPWFASEINPNKLYRQEEMMDSGYYDGASRTRRHPRPQTVELVKRAMLTVEPIQETGEFNWQLEDDQIAEELRQNGYDVPSLERMIELAKIYKL